MYSPLNRPVFVKRKHNLLSAGADHVSPIIIVYQPIVRLFSCDFRVISIRHLPAALPIKRWLSLLNHVTYAHNSGIRRQIYGKSALYMPYCPLMDCYFYTSANGEWQVVVCDLCFFFIISINGLIFIHFCKWRFWDICIQKGACSLHSRLSLFWYPAISQFCDSIIRIAYHTAIYKYGYTIIHGCDGDGSSHPVTWP